MRCTDPQKEEVVKLMVWVAASAVKVPMTYCGITGPVMFPFARDTEVPAVSVVFKVVSKIGAKIWTE